jgi:hypothetical protein
MGGKGLAPLTATPDHERIDDIFRQANGAVDVWQLMGWAGWAARLTINFAY